MANSLLPVVALLALLFGASRAADFEVGGDAGWVVPAAGDSGTYNDWASKNRFLVGDSVHFKYKADSVMEVTQEEYDKCGSTHPIFFSNNGDTEVHLDRPGPFYFISGVTGHCERGQKMVVKVIGQNEPPPAPPSGAAPAGIGSAGTMVTAAVAGVLPALIVLGV